MPTRRYLIEEYMREAYGGFITDDASVTPNLVNGWIDEGVAVAAKTNYLDAIKIDGTGYSNNSFYATFSGISISADAAGRFGYFQATLPQIALGLGANEGVGSVRINSSELGLSNSFIPLTQNQLEYFENLPRPNGVYYWNEGSTLFLVSKLNLTGEKAIVRMISGGDSTNLDSALNCPSDYLPIVKDYTLKAILNHRAQSRPQANDGADIQ